MRGHLVSDPALSPGKDRQIKNPLVPAAKREAKEDWGRAMEAREAFCIVVKFYRSADWSPALPALTKVVVCGQPLTLRQVCDMVAHIIEPLPDSVVSDLVTCLRARHQLIEENFARDRTFAAGASSLLRLMDERELAFQQMVERNAA